MKQLDHAANCRVPLAPDCERGEQPSYCWLGAILADRLKWCRKERSSWDNGAAEKNNMATTPLSLVKERFETKEKLVAAIEKLATKDLWLDRVNEDKGLARVSNAKLLRLHAALSDAKERFGSRDKLVAAICELEKRVKDDGYKTHLSAYPLPRLVDLHDAAKKRADRAAAAGSKPVPTKKKVARSKKARAKLAAAK